MVLCPLEKLWKPLVYTGVLLGSVFPDISSAQQCTVIGSITNQLGEPVNNVKIESIMHKDSSKTTAYSNQLGLYLLGELWTPIELKSFTGNYNPLENIIEVNWGVASQINNWGFKIYTSVNGSDYEEKGAVEGDGTSNVPREFDFEIPVNETGLYKILLKQIDFDGTSTDYFAEVNVKHTNTDLAKIIASPGEVLDIPFRIGKSGNVELTVYNVLGQEVKKIISEFKVPGYYAELWNGTNNLGSKVSQGVYIFELITDNFRKAQKGIYSENGRIGSHFVIPSMFNNSPIPLTVLGKKNNSSEVIGEDYTFILSGTNILPDTFDVFLSKSLPDTVINREVTQVKKILTNMVHRTFGLH